MATLKFTVTGWGKN